MTRKLRNLLVIIALVALVWLVRSFVSSESVSPIVLVVILGLLLAALLLRKSSQNPKRATELPPSQRKRNHEHKSWISRIDRD